MKYTYVHLNQETLEFSFEECEDNYGYNDDVFSNWKSDGPCTWFVVVKNTPKAIEGGKKKLAKSLIEEAQQEFAKAKTKLDFLNKLL